GFMVIGQTKSNDGDVVGFHGAAGYNYDIWMVKLSNLGELEWQKCLGGDGEEEIYHGVIKKNDYDYVIAGSSDYPSGDVVCNLHGWDDYWIFEIKDSTSGFIETQKGQKEIWVYPNPADDYVIFELKEKIIKGNIQISNIFGQVVATLSIKNQKLKIENQKLVWDTREVKPGLYFFRYEMNGVWGSGKIVISK
ncbi:MAG: T9SS type A sorting domain-containing protein, partial [Bacteroidales bacterium]|nr:T9SS type A sorting domain-containing protein [Bacteroidales bacterium]